jgi:hypothetical protein
MMSLIAQLAWFVEIGRERCVKMNKTGRLFMLGCPFRHFNRRRGDKNAESQLSVVAKTSMVSSAGENQTAFIAGAAMSQDHARHRIWRGATDGTNDRSWQHDESGNQTIAAEKCHVTHRQ